MDESCEHIKTRNDNNYYYCGKCGIPMPSESLPADGVKWPEKFDCKCKGALCLCGKSESNSYNRGWNAAVDAFMSEIAKLPRLKEIDEKEVEKVVDKFASLEVRSGEFYITLDSGTKHPVQKGDVVVHKYSLIKAIVTHFGTRVMSVEEIYHIMNKTQCRTFSVKDEFMSLHEKGIYNLTLYSQAEAIAAMMEGE